jgi:2-oxoglutarate dehydrogenase E1 component
MSETKSVYAAYSGNTYLFGGNAPARDLLRHRRPEYMYITDQAEKRWWQQKLESIRSKPSFNADKKKHILDRLTAAEGLERYLHTKYVGQKRFSLEGGESFIAAMDELIQRPAPKACRKS